jgi:hypothetical protein
LVIVGDPNFLSSTTLRPLGPSVTFTASASLLTPRRIACRLSSPWTIIFAFAIFSFPPDIFKNSDSHQLSAFSRRFLPPALRHLARAISFPPAVVAKYLPADC